VFDVTLTEDFQYDSRFDDADNIIQQYQWKKVQITESKHNGFIRLTVYLWLSGTHCYIGSYNRRLNVELIDSSDIKCV
jgi:hypothetical protein